MLVGKLIDTAYLANGMGSIRLPSMASVSTRLKYCYVRLGYWATVAWTPARIECMWPISTVEFMMILHSPGLLSMC